MIVEKKGWSWAPVPSDVIMSKTLCSADVRVYAYLLWRAGGKNYAWPNLKKISDDLTMSIASVKLSMARLADEHWIKRIRRYGKSSITYVFETQKACIRFNGSANRLADEELTGEPIIGQQVSRLKYSNRNTEKEHRAARATSSTSGERSAYDGYTPDD